MSIEETHDSIDEFTVVALKHGLFDEGDANQVVAKAQNAGISHADAALTLGILSSQEVDAINLLSRPLDLVPGYQLCGLVGRGTSGIVFRAKQLTLDRDVAIKMVSLKDHPGSSNLGRIQREAFAIARLKHVNIVGIHDSGLFAERFCLVLELVEGEDLGSRIALCGTISESITWQIARQVASALAHAGTAGIIHRDVKPANILLTQSRNGSSSSESLPLVKVTDFGLAFEGADTAHAQLTAFGSTLGTPAYVAPEQLKNTHVDKAADIYALGATVFHMLQGTPPFMGATAIQVIAAKAGGDDSWRSMLRKDLSGPTIDLFRSMTEQVPTKRISDYQTLIDRIDILLSNLDGPKTQSSRATIYENAFWLQLSRSWKRVLFASVICLVLLLSLGLIVSKLDLRVTDVTPQVVDQSSHWRDRGFPQPLFNGQSIPRVKQSGSWTIDESFHLAGRKNSSITFPVAVSSTTPPNYRFRVSVARDRDGIVEISLPHPLRHQTDISTYSLTFYQEMAGLTLVNSNLESTFLPIEGSAIVLSVGNTARDDSFDEVQMTRTKDRLELAVNGTHISTFEINDNTSHSVTIKVRQGAAAFSDLDVVELIPEQFSIGTTP